MDTTLTLLTKENYLEVIGDKDFFLEGNDVLSKFEYHVYIKLGGNYNSRRAIIEISNEDMREEGEDDVTMETLKERALVFGNEETRKEIYRMIDGNFIYYEVAV